MREMRDIKNIGQPDNLVYLGSTAGADKLLFDAEKLARELRKEYRKDIGVEKNYLGFYNMCNYAYNLSPNKLQIAMLTTKGPCMKTLSVDENNKEYMISFYDCPYENIDIFFFNYIIRYILNITYKKVRLLTMFEEDKIGDPQLYANIYGEVCNYIILNPEITDFDFFNDYAKSLYVDPSSVPKNTLINFTPTDFLLQQLKQITKFFGPKESEYERVCEGAGVF